MGEIRYGKPNMNNLPFELFGIGIAKFFLFFGTLMSLVSLFEYYNLNKKLLYSEFEEKKN